MYQEWASLGMNVVFQARNMGPVEWGGPLAAR
jgi:hypothetical protein